MSDIKLVVLYPYPTDVNQFDKDYETHLELLKEKSGPGGLPFTITRFKTAADGSQSPYHVMFVAGDEASQTGQFVHREKDRDLKLSEYPEYDWLDWFDCCHHDSLKRYQIHVSLHLDSTKKRSYQFFVEQSPFFFDR